MDEIIKSRDELNEELKNLSLLEANQHQYQENEYQNKLVYTQMNVIGKLNNLALVAAKDLLMSDLKRFY